MERRDFLRRAAGGGAILLVAPALLRAQGTAPPEQGSGSTAAPGQGTTSNLFDMNQEAAKSARRPPKPGARASMSNDERDALEHQIRCQCGCTLDVYTCRTTDFSCQVSPAMHRDVIALVEGGYSAREILDAFVGTYGERALMAPRREGFNLAGYLVPFAALGAGFAGLIVALRRMQRRPATIPGAGVATIEPPRLGSDDELARLQAAIRRDE
jgi:cytochrome c-type biogenesis protein CcmH